MAEEITLNQIGVMIEELRSDVKAVAEGHAVIRHEMQQMKEELVENINENTLKVGILAKEVIGLKTEVSGLKIEVSDLKIEVKDNGDKIDRFDSKLDEHIRQPMHSVG
jgi:predicted  nucleic acid-binding Zn-ribbon protein